MTEPTDTPPSQEDAPTLRDGAASAEDAGDGALGVGTRLGRYLILGAAGRGGMARVLRAYDPKLQREVALKVVRADRLDPEARARMLREARAMARLSHPNVVAVYDAEDSRVGIVLVLEYVAGQTLEQWARQRPRAWTEIVECFLAAGRGLVAAHDENLLHRDFKPSNVLVADSGQVKVTDFGLAKSALEQGGDPSPVPARGSIAASLDDSLTQSNVVVGTPRYMAPEQHFGEPLGPATDQYAFCVALWETLAGQPPFGGHSLVHDKTSGPPAWPHESSRVPRPIVDALRRGLASDPADRWPSMEALITALVYRPERRRRWGWAAAGSLAALALGGIALESWLEGRARRCSGAQAELATVWNDGRRAALASAVQGTPVAFAERAWARTAPRLDRYAEDWIAMHTDACEATTIRGEQSAPLMDRRMACLQRAKAGLAAVIGVLESADAQVVQRAHEVTDGLPPLARCADADALASEVEPPPRDDAELVGRAREQLARADVLVAAGLYPEAARLLDTIEGQLRGVEYPPVRVELMLARGDVLERLGDYEASAMALRQALERATEQHRWPLVLAASTQLMYLVGERLQRPEEALHYRELARGLSRGDPRARARVHTSVGSVLRVHGRYDEAAGEHQQAIALWEQSPGDVTLQLATSRNNLAVVWQEQGEYAKAEAEHRLVLEVREQELGTDHPYTATSRNNLASVLHAQGRYDEAEAEYRAVLTVREAVLGPGHTDVAASRNNLASTLQIQGRYAEAEVEYRRALPSLEGELGPDHPSVASLRSNIALVLEAQGQHAEAEAEYREALGRLERGLGPLHPEIASSRTNLALALQAQGKHAEAVVEHRRALEIMAEALGPEHPHVAAIRSNLGLALQAQGKHAEAEVELRTALAGLDRALGPEHPHAAATATNLAVALLHLGHPQEALTLAERSWERRRQADIPAEGRAETAFVLARALWASSEAGADRSPRAPQTDSTDARARALDLAHRSHDGYADAGDAYDPQRVEVAEWLREHR